MATEQERKSYNPATIATKSTEWLEAKVAEVEARALKQFKEMQRRPGSHMVATNYANTVSSRKTYREALADRRKGLI